MSSYKKFLVVIFLLSLSTLLFFLLLRHKSPHLSDSYFYIHTYYQLQGDSFEEAKDKVVSQIDLKNADIYTKFIFGDDRGYQNAYTFFQKRPFLPTVSFILSFFYNNTYINFLIPIFLGYLGTILLTFWLTQKAKGLFFATLVTSSLIAFYPFRDWTTYFLTDGIGAFFWFLQLYLVFLYFKTKKQKFFYSSLLVFILSLTNREQNLLLIPFFYLLTIFFYLYQFPKDLRKLSTKMAITLSVIGVLYILLTQLTHQRTFLDTVIYNQSQYGMEPKVFTLSQTLEFMKNQIIIWHLGMFSDLLRRPWSLIFLILSVLGAIKLFLFNKKPALLDLIFLSSTLSSYGLVFLFQVLSYRYYYPLIIGIIFFAWAFIFDFFKIKTAELKL